MIAPSFIPGLELSRRFYVEAVRPLLDEVVPDVVYSAARVGSGSEVLGFDTARSADHEWGPRLQLFLRPDDVSRHGPRVLALLSERLPKTFLGYPTNFAPTGELDIRVMQATDGPVHHRVDVSDPGSWFIATLGFDPGAGVTLADWLATPTQLLAEVTAGEVFHDGLGQLAKARDALGWYPHDLWLYLLACQWRRISQEEAFVGRCGEVGDELGSAVVAARLVRDLMRLCLLMERRYPPYTKWLGSAFARLGCAHELVPAMTSVLAATDWHVRERHLAEVYEAIAARHNDLALTDLIDPATRPYHQRPFRVLRAERFTAALTARIGDPAVRALALIGAIDQFVDNADALSEPGLARVVGQAVRASQAVHERG